MRFRPSLLALGAALIFVTLADGQEWTRFRGPGGSGLSNAKNLPVEITDANIKWRVDLPGNGHSSPVLWGDTVFLTTSGGGKSGRRSVVALSAENGAEKWRSEYRFTPYRQHRFNDFASSTPCVDAQRVYVTWTSPEGVEVLAIDHAGKRVWSKTVGEFSAVHGSSASPVLASGMLVIGSHSEKGESFIIGLDPKTGKEKWRVKRTTGSTGAYSTPTLRAISSGAAELVFSSTAHGLTAIDPATGKIRWEHDPGFSKRCVGSPVISGDIVFTAAGSGGGGKESTVVQIIDGKPQPAWKAGKKGLPYVPTGIAFEGSIFLLSDGGVMSCRRAVDGELLWQKRVIGAPYASPIIVDGRIYCCSKEGKLVVLEAGDKYLPLGSYQFPDGIDGIYATPAATNGRLYVRTFSQLFCISGRP